VKSLAIEEAYRTIRIREAGRVEKIPVIQAILRKIAIAAANGNARAQQTYLNLLTGAEADRRVASMELFTAAVEYKEHWHQILAERARTGTTGPEGLISLVQAGVGDQPSLSSPFARLLASRFHPVATIWSRTTRRRELYEWPWSSRNWRFCFPLASPLGARLDGASAG
jgi:Family of unknown function (DUF5681)